MKKTKESISPSWDPIWDEVFLNQQWGKYPSENLIQFVARNFYNSEKDSIKILEVGCGTGANLWYVAREGFQAFGVDGSKEAIRQAIKRMESEKLTVKLEVSDIVNLNFDDNYFDAVIDIECIYSNDINNSRKILKEIRRVLKPEGKFYSRTFSDEIFLGKKIKKNKSLEYVNVDEGPLKGKGFVRLSSIKSINELYGEFFNLESLDYLEYTSSSGLLKIKEWIIVCKK